MFGNKNKSKKTIKDIQELGLPIVFENIWNDKIPSELECIYSKPKSFFSLKRKLIKKNPNIEFYIPLLESNSDTIYAYDTRNKHYVEYYYFCTKEDLADGDDGLLVYGRNYQQFIGSIFVDLLLSGLDSHIKTLTSIFEFKYYDELMKSSELDFDDHLEDWEVRNIIIKNYV